MIQPCAKTFDIEQPQKMQPMCAKILAARWGVCATGTISAKEFSAGRGGELPSDYNASVAQTATINVGLTIR